MTNREIQRLIERVVEKAWTHTFGVSTSPRLASAKGDLINSAATILREELRKYQPPSEPPAEEKPPPVIGWDRWVCKQCGKERRRSECLHCGNAEPITDEPRTPGYVR